MPKAMSSAAEIRSELHDLIDAIADPNVLEAMRTLLAAQWPADLPPASLSVEEEAAIAEGIRQLDAGQGIPHEQVMAEAWAQYGR